MCPQLRYRTWCQGESQELFLRRNLLNNIIPSTSPVPEGHHFVSITSHRNTEGPCQPKVSQLDLPLGVHQQVLRLEIPKSI